MNETRSIRLIENIASAELHEAVWKATGLDARWEYGHSSGTGRGAPFWYMDLSKSEPIDALWRHVRVRCEAFVGSGLRVLRQYANGHTFGQGGGVHQDDFVPETYTLLYYPVTEWQIHWDGETVFHNHNGDVVAAIRPAPNRAVLFDSRIPHVGRAPSRACEALRVTVAFKLKARSGD